LGFIEMNQKITLQYILNLLKNNKITWKEANSMKQALIDANRN